jgi:hypothetical protein
LLLSAYSSISGLIFRFSEIKLSFSERLFFFQIAMIDMLTLLPGCQNPQTRHDRSPASRCSCDTGQANNDASWALLALSEI